MGSSLSVQLLSHLKRMQNRAVCFAFSLKSMIVFLIIISNYIGFPRINLLNFILYVRCTNSSICCIPFEPPIQFKQSHSHYIRAFSSFARIFRYKLNFFVTPVVFHLFTICLPISLSILLLM